MQTSEFLTPLTRDDRIDMFDSTTYAVHGRDDELVGYASVGIEEVGPSAIRVLRLWVIHATETYISDFTHYPQRPHVRLSEDGKRLELLTPGASYEEERAAVKLYPA